jgi:hypothetical protein
MPNKEELFKVKNKGGAAPSTAPKNLLTSIMDNRLQTQTLINNYSRFFGGTARGSSSANQRSGGVIWRRKSSLRLNSNANL